MDEFFEKLRADIKKEKENKCKGIFGKLFGHKFQARYDEEKVERMPLEFKGNITESLAEIMKHKASKKMYVQDVCVRCGAVRNRKEGVK